MIEDFYSYDIDTSSEFPIFSINFTILSYIIIASFTIFVINDESFDLNYLTIRDCT
jgi:hypothetical protein